MNSVEFATEMNKLGKAKIPFLFVIDFEMEKPFLVKLDEVNSDILLFDINGLTNASVDAIPKKEIVLKKFPITQTEYDKKFKKVFQHLEYGDSFLTNLTTKTEIKIDLALRDIFYASKAKYKLLFGDEFLVFSPETFIQIRHSKIYSYPMKGTIDASLPGASEKILQDNKELSEHVTITDLIRNDLSQVATGVEVVRFRYIDEIKTQTKTLLQISSEIQGRLESDYHAQLGDILVRLLPAGSVSGAPKPRTLEIIRECEEEKRGYYTGVFGIFNGDNLDSGVMIRYIERHGEKYYYRSGGGITTQSTSVSEYQEAIDKIYVPVY